LVAKAALPASPSPAADAGPARTIKAAANPSLQNPSFLISVLLDKLPSQEFLPLLGPVLVGVPGAGRAAWHHRNLERHDAFHIEPYLGVAGVPVLPASRAHAKD
jgi:hypothetical protein